MKKPRFQKQHSGDYGRFDFHSLSPLAINQFAKDSTALTLSHHLDRILPTVLYQRTLEAGGQMRAGAVQAVQLSWSSHKPMLTELSSRSPSLATLTILKAAGLFFCVVQLVRFGQLHFLRGHRPKQAMGQFRRRPRHGTGSPPQGWPDWRRTITQQATCLGFRRQL